MGEEARGEGGEGEYWRMLCGIAPRVGTRGIMQDIWADPVKGLGVLVSCGWMGCFSPDLGLLATERSSWSPHDVYDRRAVPPQH